jgi:hypothetical protein
MLYNISMLKAHIRHRKPIRKLAYRTGEAIPTQLESATQQEQITPVEISYEDLMLIPGLNIDSFRLECVRANGQDEWPTNETRLYGVLPSGEYVYVVVGSNYMLNNLECPKPTEHPYATPEELTQLGDPDADRTNLTVEPLFDEDGLFDHKVLVVWNGYPRTIPVDIWRIFCAQHDIDLVQNNPRSSDGGSKYGKEIPLGDPVSEVVLRHHIEIIPTIVASEVPDDSFTICPSSRDDITPSIIAETKEPIITIYDVFGAVKELPASLEQYAAYDRVGIPLSPTDPLTLTLDDQLDEVKAVLNQSLHDLGQRKDKTEIIKAQLSYAKIVEHRFKQDPPTIRRHPLNFGKLRKQRTNNIKKINEIQNLYDRLVPTGEQVELVTEQLVALLEIVREHNERIACIVDLAKNVFCDQVLDCVVVDSSVLIIPPADTTDYRAVIDHIKQKYNNRPVGSNSSTNADYWSIQPDYIKLLEVILLASANRQD